MTGLDRITEKIIEQAKLQAENRVSYAEKTAKDNEESLKKRFETTMEAEKNRAENEGKEAAKRVIANVTLEGRKKKLAARQEVVDLVFEKAIEKIADLPEKKYLEFLTNLVVYASYEGENELILNSSDKNNYGDKLVKILKEKGINAKISGEEIKTIGGLIIRSEDIQTNITLESIVRFEREKLETDVVGLIFESE